MSSSTQIKNTQVSGTAPGVNNGESRQSSWPSSHEEQARRDAITEFYASPAPPKWPWAYRAYWYACRAGNLAHLHPQVFYKHLQAYRPPVVTESARPKFPAVGQNQMMFNFNLVGGLSS